MRKHHLTLILCGLLFTLPVFASDWFQPTEWFTSDYQSNSIDQEAKILSEKAHFLDPDVIKMGLTAYQKAKAEGYAQKPFLVIIDFSKPSSEPRMVVFDLNRNVVLYEVLVAHGKNSGGIQATHFSNQPNSLESSLGVFVTGETYSGKHGVSLRLNGLEPGFNDNARDRGVVIHGANYVNSMVAQHYGQVGRSWGCPAVPMSVVGPMVQKIKEGSVIFAYYPDKRWLHSSTFLHA